MIKRYLTQFTIYLRALFGNFLGARSEGPRFENSDPVSGEPLTRYVYSKRDFGVDRVKLRAFLPDRNGETSVFRVSGLTREFIRNTLAFTARRDKAALGAGHFGVRNVWAVNLTLDPNNTPERHANIVAWPPEKEERKMRAQELANKAEFEPYPRTVGQD